MVPFYLIELIFHFQVLLHHLCQLYRKYEFVSFNDLINLLNRFLFALQVNNFTEKTRHLFFDLFDFENELVPKLVKIDFFRYKAWIHKADFSRERVDFKEFIFVLVDVFADPAIFVKILSRTNHLAIRIKRHNLDVRMRV